MIGGEALVVHYGDWRIDEGESPAQEVVDFDSGRRGREGLGVLCFGRNQKARGLKPCQRLGFWLGVEISRQNDGMVALPESRYEVVHLSYPE